MERRRRDAPQAAASRYALWARRIRDGASGAAHVTTRIKVILGSTRQKRFGDKPAYWICEEARALRDVEVECLDLRDYPMPFFDEPMSPMWGNGSYHNAAVQRWAAMRSSW
jgi:NADPH-dependent FMN reductase